MGVEFERRFLLSALPNGFDWVYTKVIRQVYWDLGDGWALRLRRQGEADFPDDVVTLKGPRHGSSRPEYEWGLGAEEENGHNSSSDPAHRSQSANPDAASLYRAGARRQIVKTRRGAVVDGVTWDFDEFHFANEGLFIAEVEMKDRAAVDAIKQPAWAVREVTDDPRFNNENLAVTPFTAW